MACERLLLMCYKFYNEMQWQGLDLPAQNLGVPVLLTFFDYNEGSPPRPTAESMELALGYSLPLVIRLPMMKYKPWLWPLGIGILSESIIQVPHHCGRSPFLRRNDVPRRVPTEYIDDFVGRFVSRRNYRQVLLEDLHVFRIVDRNRCEVNSGLLKYVDVRLATLKCSVEELHDFDTRVERKRCALAEGAVLTNVADSYEEFCIFLNAYLSLPAQEQRGCSAFSSFVLSLNKSAIFDKEKS